jgi:lycopene cyclase domain-containing protein
MTYTQLAFVAVGLVVVLDLAIARTRLLRRRVFWTAYAIIVLFQLVTNGILTGLRIVRYDGAAIGGSSTPTDAPPPFLGDGRVAYAPFEDLLFGFALVTLTLVLWVWAGRRGVQRTPYAGPPRRRWPGAAAPDPGSTSHSA